MPRLQRFEGPDLEQLLDRVRAEAGSEATIVEATKLRKGGVGGFFSKESYEVVVDVDASPSPARPDAGTAPATGRPSAAASPRQAIAGALGLTGSPRPGLRDAPGSGFGPDEDNDPDDQAFQPMSLLEMAERVDRDERSANGEIAALLREPHFNDLLASAVRDAGGVEPDVAPADHGPTNPLRPNDGGGIPAPAGDVAVASNLVPAWIHATRGVTGGPRANEVGTHGDGTALGGPDRTGAAATDRLRDAASFASRAAGLNGTRPAANGPAGLGGHRGAHAPTGNGLLNQPAVAYLAVANLTVTDPVVSATAVPSPTTVDHGFELATYDSHADSQWPLAPSAGQRSHDLVLHQLSRVGIPTQMLQELEAALAEEPIAVPALSVHVELARILDRLPSVPPLPVTRGSLVAVVGPRKAALRLARDLADRLDLDPDRIVLAAPSDTATGSQEVLLHTAAEAADHRRAWNRRKRPTVVVLDSPVGSFPPAWAAGLLDELEPAMTWGVVDAARKPEDIEAWAGALGGIDALEVRKLDQTTSPASVLHTGIPVAYLDGR